MFAHSALVTPSLLDLAQAGKAGKGTSIPWKTERLVVTWNEGSTCFILLEASGELLAFNKQTIGKEKSEGKTPVVATKGWSLFIF